MNMEHKLFNFKITGLIALLFSVAIMNAQNRTFKHLTPRDGLPTGFVWTMMQDEKGFIWIGTNTGISKFDGYSFTNYRPDVDDPNSIAGNTVSRIAQYDEDHLVIASSLGIEILTLSSGHFELLKLPPSLPALERVFDIVLLPTGEIYAASIQGIYYFSDIFEKGENPEIEFFPFEKNSEIQETQVSVTMDWDKNQTIYISRENNLEKLDLSTKEINKLETSDKEFKDLVEGNIWELFVDSRNDLIITSALGLAVWKQGEESPKIITELGPFGPKELSSAGFQSITEDSEGNLWLGTATLGAIRWNPETNDVQTIRNNPDNQNSINSDDVHYAFVDAQDNTWFGYHNMGISLMYSNIFNYQYKLAVENVDRRNPLNQIQQIKEDDNGNLWFATAGGLVRHNKEGDIETFLPNPQGSEGNGIANFDILEGKLFAVSDTLRNIYEFNFKDNTFTRFPVEREINLLSFAMLKKEDEYLIGSMDGKIIRIQEEDYGISSIDIPYDDSYEGPIKPVFPFVEIDGSISVFAFQALNSGPPTLKLFKLNLENEELTELNFEILSTPNPAFGLPRQSSIQPYVYWIRRSEGIVKLNINTGETELLFTDESGVISMGIPFLTEDRDGILWHYTGTDFLKLDPLTESASYLETDADRRPDNLLGGRQLESGELVFPGLGGYITFNPNDLQQDDAIPYVHITELNSGETTHETLYSDIPIEIEGSNNNLSFSYLGLNFRDPSFTRYRYRITGFSEDWVSVGTQQSVFLANLPPGDYIFEVQAAPRFGEFGDNSARVNFKIPPPWYLTWPAYLLYALILFITIFVFDRIQRRRVIARERERSREKELKQAKEIEVAYENLKATQNKLIHSEKLASLGQLTAGIAHEIKNPLNFVNNFSEVSLELVEEAREEVGQLEKSEKTEAVLELLGDIRSNLGKIYQHGTRANGIVSSMLQHSRGGSGKLEPTNLNALVKEYVNLAYHGMRAGKNPINVEITFDLDEKLGDVNLIGEDFSRVVLNLVNNGFDAMREKSNTDPEYSPVLSIFTKRKGETVEIVVEDNGPGIPENIKNKILQPFFTTKKGTEGTGLGLSITHDIIKAHGGELILENQMGGGARLIVSLPNSISELTRLEKSS